MFAAHSFAENPAAITSTWPVALRHRKYTHLMPEDAAIFTAPLDRHVEQARLPVTPPTKYRKHHNARRIFTPPSPDQWRSSPSSSAGMDSFFQRGDDVPDIDAEDTLFMYESALRRHFPVHDGWIIQRDYPLHIFTDKFFMNDPTESLPLEDGISATPSSHSSRAMPDLTTIALVIEHSSCPGEPVLILDLNDALPIASTDMLDDCAKYRAAILLDLMGWQLNDLDRFVLLIVLSPLSN